MSNRIYSKPVIRTRRNPDWLAKIIRWCSRKKWHLSQDWACTKLHAKNFMRVVSNKALRIVNEYYMTVTVCFASAFVLAIGLVAMRYIEIWVGLR